MKTITDTNELGRVKKGCVLTIGNFDGFHTGHREILIEAKRLAEDKSTQLAVMTFEPHPVAVLHPQKAMCVLTPLAFKKTLLADAGADILIVLKDNREFLNLPPADFVSKFLTDKIRPAAVVEGDDFNFGRNRQGDVRTLKNLGDKSGFDVVVIEAKQAKLSTGQIVKVSSTMIRYMLEAGHVADAAAALGRPYRLAGPIVPGRQNGKKLGFPTLNMQKTEQVTPAEGVYAGTVEIADNLEKVISSSRRIPAVFSIGQAATFGRRYRLLIEAHLLNGIGQDVTGKWFGMDFIQRIRSQHKFKTEAVLAEQIAKDCQKAKQILAAEDANLTES